MRVDSLEVTIISALKEVFIKDCPLRRPWRATLD